MTARLIDLLLPLSRRERGLLGLAVLILLLGVGVGGLLPLQEARQEAAVARQEARDLQAWVSARIVEKQSLKRAETPIVSKPIGLSGIEQGLVSARLRPAVSELVRQEDGGVTLRFDEVDFLRLARWLSNAHPAWSYQIAQFRLEALDTPGQVAAWLTLSPAQEQ